jgi:carbonic anhydrase
MQKLIEGVQQFQETVFSPQRKHFERLKDGQNPGTLFITCSDSRIDPNLLTQTRPGDLFILRNAGNIIPPYSPGHFGGEAPTIEYAVAALGVQDVIVCGHTRCGAMKALLNPEMVEELPLVAAWLAQAETTRRLVQAYQRSGGRTNPNGHWSANGYGARTENGQMQDVPMQDDLSPEEAGQLLEFTVQRNVLVQIENLRTHPAVAAALAHGDLRLHGWVYRIETGGVDAYDPDEGKFVCLSEQQRTRTTELAGISR